MLIFSIILFPILGAILTSFINKEHEIKRLALIFTILTMIVSLFLWETIDFNSGYYVYTNVLENLSFCNFTVGVDGLSIYFVLLTTFTFPICVLASWINIKKNLKNIKKPFGNKRYYAIKKTNGKRNKQFAKMLKLKYKNLPIPEKISNVIPILNKGNIKILILSLFNYLIFKP